jgi:protein TonB
LAVVGVALAASMLRLTPVPPDITPSIDLVLGTGATTTGRSLPPPQPATQAPPDPAARPTPPPADAATPAAQPAMRLPPPSPQGSVAAGAPQTPPPPQPNPPVAPPVPSAPPPALVTQATPPHAAPVVSLGDGIAAPAAEIEDAGMIHPAQSDSGNVAPIYPEEARRRHEQGTVVLWLVVGPDGAMKDVQIRQSSGSPSLDAAARNRLLTWHFRPATRDGVAVEDSFSFVINFSPK